MTSHVKTGDSCAISNSIQFSSTTLSVYSNAALTSPQIQFTTSQTGYFGAVLQAINFDVSLLTFSLRSVCVMLGNGNK